MTHIHKGKNLESELLSYELQKSFFLPMEIPPARDNDSRDPSPVDSGFYDSLNPYHGIVAPENYECDFVIEPESEISIKFPQNSISYDCASRIIVAYNSLRIGILNDYLISKGWTQYLIDLKYQKVSENLYDSHNSSSSRRRAASEGPRILASERTALNTIIFDPLMQSEDNIPDLIIYNNEIGNPLDFGRTPAIRGDYKNSKSIDFLKKHLLIYDPKRGNDSFLQNTANENSGNYTAYFYNMPIEINACQEDNYWDRNNFLEFCPQNNPFNLNQINEIKNFFKNVYVPLRKLNIKIQDLAQIIKALTNPMISRPSRQNVAKNFIEPSEIRGQYEYFNCVFSSDLAIPNYPVVLKNDEIICGGLLKSHDIIRNQNVPSLIFNHDKANSNAAIITYYKNILTAFEKMHQYSQNNNNDISWELL